MCEYLKLRWGISILAKLIGMKLKCSYDGLTELGESSFFIGPHRPCSTSAMDGVKVLIKHTLPCSISPLAAFARLYVNVPLGHHPKDDV